LVHHPATDAAPFGLFPGLARYGEVKPRNPTVLHAQTHLLPGAIAGDGKRTILSGVTEQQGREFGVFHEA